MHALYYVDLIKRAVAAQDTATLEQLGRHMADCEEAKQILRSKGYGCSGMPVSDTARQVPDKPK